MIFWSEKFNKLADFVLLLTLFLFCIIFIHNKNLLKLTFFSSFFEMKKVCNISLNKHLHSPPSSTLIYSKSYLLLKEMHLIKKKIIYKIEMRNSKLNWIMKQKLLIKSYWTKEYLHKCFSRKFFIKYCLKFLEKKTWKQKIKTHVNTPRIIKSLRNLSLYILVIITIK